MEPVSDHIQSKNLEMASSHPIVLVTSPNVQKSEEIITKIRKIPLAEAKTDNGHVYNIKTKYYETDICLYPHSGSLDISSDVLKQVEGVLIYFEAGNRQFLDQLKSYADFIEANDIEFGILLCDELFEDSSKGVTFKEAKKYCHILDVIELEPSKSEGEDDDGADNVTGVDELIQAMHNFIWSNVDLNRRGNSDSGGGDADDEGNEPADENHIEEELIGFEKLLTQVMQFRPNTSSWTRNERLAYAQDFAELFDDLIGDDAD